MSDLQRNVRRPGDLDITFGNAGTVSLELTRAADVIMFDPTSGNITGAISGNGGFEVFRLLDDGQLDQTFGDNGIAHGRFTTLDTHQRPTSLRLLDDGSLFVAGESNGSAALPTHPAAALFTSDGQPDPSFGTEGSVLITLTPPTRLAARTRIGRASRQASVRVPRDRRSERQRSHHRPDGDGRAGTCIRTCRAYLVEIRGGRGDLLRL